jgi:hypothetical protein
LRKAFAGPEQHTPYRILARDGIHCPSKPSLPALANTPMGPLYQIQIYPFGNVEACLLIPYPQLSTSAAKLVVENPDGNPSSATSTWNRTRKLWRILTDSLQLLNPIAGREAFPYPTGSMRPEDEAFWFQDLFVPGELTVEEYPVVENSVDSPSRFDFLQHIPEKKSWKNGQPGEKTPEKRIASNNLLLQPLGLSLKLKDTSEMELYELHEGMSSSWTKSAMPGRFL